MIQQQTYLDIADNTGAKQAMCIKVLRGSSSRGKFKRKAAHVGDVLTATVLPAQDGTDRISLLGQILPAQLPPGINPGETIALQVTAFTNSAVIVRNLGAIDPEEAPPEAPPRES